MTIHFLPPKLDRYDAAIEDAIATCNGDLHGALRALMLVNEQLEAELMELQAAMETGGTPLSQLVRSGRGEAETPSLRASRPPPAAAAPPRRPEPVEQHRAGTENLGKARARVRVTGEVNDGPPRTVLARPHLVGRRAQRRPSARYPGSAQATAYRQCAADRAQGCCSFSAPSPSSPPAGDTNQTGTLVLARAISPKYASEDPGQARMHTCVDQYVANKVTNSNAGMKWIEQGGGYYSVCNQKLK